VAPDPTVNYQLSQRADHILKTMASRVRFNRALINPKWETMYSHGGMTRLHLLFGEANQNEFAYALKVGTTSLVLRALEGDRVPVGLCLREPLIALRQVSRDSDYKWLIELADGTTISAIDLQREYLHLCETYRGESAQTDWILDNWASILDGLETDPLTMGAKLDWAAKLGVVRQYMASEGVTWDDDALHSVDLEYHNIDPEQSLFYALQGMGQTARVCTDIEILDAMTEPPSNTRAKGRARLVQQVLKRKSRSPYMFDWNGVAVDRNRYIDMPDPFETYETATDQWGGII
jgi:proteasome accessory factor A